MNTELVLIVGSAAFLLAGTVKGLTGLGLPTVAIALLTLAFDPRTAISLVLFPMIGSNFWQLLRAGEIARTGRRYGLFAFVLFLGVAATTFVTRETTDRALLAVLGAVILFFVAFSWKGWVPAIADRFDGAAQVGFGVFAGIIGGMTAGWAAPLAMYLTARGVDKDEFVRASGFLIFVGSLPLLAAYAQLGFLTGSLSLASALMLVPTLLGFAAGEAQRNRASPARFRNILLIVFVFLGLNLIRRAIWFG
ncbi:MAG: sulfite exporter TauE/SafE family protein [Pseudomonadota bacterium]